MNRFTDFEGWMKVIFIFRIFFFTTNSIIPNFDMILSLVKCIKEVDNLEYGLASRFIHPNLNNVLKL